MLRMVENYLAMSREVETGGSDGHVVEIFSLN